MLKILITNLFFLSICFNGFTQIDTSLKKKQRGFLFLSSYNFLYDRIRGEMNPVGFHDYFFSSNVFDRNCFLDSNKNIDFKNGVRVGTFKERRKLKERAILINCKDVNGCYVYDKFYVIPVIIDYKLYEDNWPLACRSEFFDIEVIKGSKLRFYHEHKVITPIRVVILSINKK